jgi:hypothetical protein
MATCIKHKIPTNEEFGACEECMYEACEENLRNFTCFYEEVARLAYEPQAAWLKRIKDAFKKED